MNRLTRLSATGTGGNYSSRNKDRNVSGKQTEYPVNDREFSNVNSYVDHLISQSPFWKKS
ncbi:MAG: hypothetical protein PHO44_02420 [Sphaerochaetaceae bacterium]|jgi:hypothetical protein|nr:hypothetical protein [Sphaerochaetaceae bacterium]MDD3162485.1 hypothetical protein [Sphaerochaetaceae bacterium]MDD4006813.1 hypothetical protein [Sphaerochaetaceae bacterium]MDD4396261.1 hypothetical protein [Sphaerochaetaceae bacterium]